MNRMIPVIAAALALCGAASAQAAEGVRINFSDLDLASAKGQTAAKIRINRAADVVCGDTLAPRPMVQVEAIKACRTDAIGRATASMQRMAAAQATVLVASR